MLQLTGIVCASARRGHRGVHHHEMIETTSEAQAMPAFGAEDLPFGRRCIACPIPCIALRNAPSQRANLPHQLSHSSVPLVLNDEALAAESVKRYVADGPGYPDRIEMRDGKPGETFLLLNHVCQQADSPYRASHAIFVREGAEDTFDQRDTIPEAMRTRLLSLRAFDESGMMVDADIVEGKEVEGVIEKLFENSDVSYIHAHNAIWGCYSGRIDRD